MTDDAMLREKAKAVVETWDCILPLSYAEQETHATAVAALSAALEERPPIGPNGEIHPPPRPHWVAIHGMVQFVLAAYDQERGWLSARHGMIYGGHHGKAPMIEGDLNETAEIVQREVKNALRAIKARWEKP